MHTKIRNNLSNIPRLGMRLALFMALMAMIFNSVLPVAAAPALALSTVAVGAQSGTLTYGSAGTATFNVTVSRTLSTPGSFTPSVTGLPAGVTGTFTPSGSVSFSGATRTITLNITKSAAPGTAGGNYTFSVQASGTGPDPIGTGTLIISPATSTVTFGPAPTPTFLGGNFTVSATTNSNGALTYSAVSGPCALVSGATFSTSGAGACVVQAATAATTSFIAGSAQQSVTIAPATPTINFGANPYPLFPGGDFTLVATTNSDGARTYSYVSGPCTLVDANQGIFTPTDLSSNSGPCVVQANTTATTNFLAGSAQQSVIIVPPGANLYAVAGSTTLPATPSPLVVTTWGYTIDGSPATQPGGPTLEATQGDIVVVTLHNNLSEPTSLLIQGQVMAPDLVGVAPGGSKNYAFLADHAGTYLYEAGLLANAQHQVAMGLYGVLIVRPLGAPGQAYADTSTVYDDEATLLLSEIDPALNNHANPAAFDMRDYNPKYWLINGKVYPNTDPIPVTTAGNDVLLRYVNAGLQAHSMAVLGLHQRVVAQDGSPLLNAHTIVAETIAPGQTADAITTVPATTGPDSKFALYDAALMLRNSNTAGFGGMLTFLTIGGTVVGDTTGPTTNALALLPDVPNAGDLGLTAMVDDSASGGSNIQDAQYYIDTTASTPVGMNATDGAFDEITEAVDGSIPAATLNALSAGSHTVYVRGQDAAGNWGAFALATIFVDQAGPATTGLVLNPNPSNGSVDVALSATGDDSATGNSNIAAAVYTIDGGAPQTMAVNNAAPIASLTAVIPATTVAALTDGVHVVGVQSQDALGNLGAVTTKNLLVDKTAPTTSGVNAAPNPNNGALGLSPTQPIVRVTATFDDVFVGPAALNQTAATDNANVPVDTTLANHVYLPLITSFATAENAVTENSVEENSVEAAAILPDTNYVKTAEGFIDTPGANGAGFPFAASDGLFDQLHEVGYADIPLTTVNLLSAGNHTIYVHSQDEAGNWETTYATVILIIDKLAPTVTSITLVPATTNSTPVVINAAATDVATGNSNIAAGEYFIDNTTGAAGTGTAMTASPSAPASTLNATIPAAALATLTEGTHTVSVRARDAAGNWGPLFSVASNLLIDRTAPTISNVTVAPSPTGGAATVAASVTASDNGGGSGLNGGVYWIDGSATTPPVGAVAFGGTTSPIAISGINVSALTAGNHNLRVRVQDVAGNVSAVFTRQFTVSIPQPPLYFSTSGNTNPPGLTTGADDADIYFYDGSIFSRAIDVTAITNPLPGGANVDGFDRVDNTHFYMSFDGSVTIVLPGPDLTVQDEDVVFYNAGTWSVYFDGTPAARGLSGTDIDAINVVGSTLYFSTGDGTVPAGVAGTGDDADIYSWNGTSFSRVIDASTAPYSLPGAANVDGFVRVDATHFYMSFSSTTTALPVTGNVEDEDVVFYNAGVWSIYFDGTALGLTDGNHDLDAFDLP